MDPNKDQILRPFYGSRKEGEKGVRRPLRASQHRLTRNNPRDGGATRAAQEGGSGSVHTIQSGLARAAHGGTGRAGSQQFTTTRQHAKLV